MSERITFAIVAKKGRERVEVDVNAMSSGELLNVVAYLFRQASVKLSAES